MKKILSILAFMTVVAMTSLSADGYKVGQTFKITGINPKISPPLYLTDTQGQQIAKLKDITNPYQGRTTPGIGVATYLALKDISDADFKNATAQVTHVSTSKIAPTVATLTKLQQPNAGILAPGRALSRPGVTVRSQAASSQDQKMATISEQPAVKGTIATVTKVPVPSQGQIQDIVIPGTPQRIATVDQTAQPQWITTTTQRGSAEYPAHEGTMPTYTPMVSRPQQAGTQILPEPQYGAASVPAQDNSVREALEAAAKRAKDAAEKLRQDVNLGTMSQEAKQKMLMDAVQKADLDAVKRILESGFKDNGKALEQAELFALDPDDQNAQSIVNLLKNAQE